MISELDEEVTDFDWFALDRQGRIGHFTTGGDGTLPRTVAASKDDLLFLTNFFWGLGRTSAAGLAPRAQAAARQMRTDEDIARRFEDYLEMA